MASIHRSELKNLFKQRAARISIDIPPVRQKVNSTSVAHMPLLSLIGEAGMETLIEALMNEAEQRLGTSFEGGVTLID